MALKIGGAQVTVTAATAESFLNFGNGTPENTDVSAMGFDIVTSQDFVGSLTPVIRGVGLDESNDDTSFVIAPFRAAYLNGAAPADPLAEGWPMQVAGTAITGRSIILVPAPGVSVGLALTITQGSATINRQPMAGNTRL